MNIELLKKASTPSSFSLSHPRQRCCGAVCSRRAAALTVTWRLCRPAPLAASFRSPRSAESPCVPARCCGGGWQRLASASFKPAAGGGGGATPRPSRRPAPAAASRDEFKGQTPVEVHDSRAAWPQVETTSRARPPPNPPDNDARRSGQLHRQAHGVMPEISPNEHVPNIALPNLLHHGHAQPQNKPIFL